MGQTSELGGAKPLEPAAVGAAPLADRDPLREEETFWKRLVSGERLQRRLKFSSEEFCGFDPDGTAVFRPILLATEAGVRGIRVARPSGLSCLVAKSANMALPDLSVFEREENVKVTFQAQLALTIAGSWLTNGPKMASIKILILLALEEHMGPLTPKLTKMNDWRAKGGSLLLFNMRPDWGLLSTALNVTRSEPGVTSDSTKVVVVDQRYALNKLGLSEGLMEFEACVRQPPVVWTGGHVVAQRSDGTPYLRVGERCALIDAGKTEDWTEDERRFVGAVLASVPLLEKD